MSQRAFSFEFFPPKTPAGREKLRATWQELARLQPRFFSVTFGAGGSTRAGTLDTVLEIRGAGHEAAPHLSCVASTKGEISAVLEQYKASGIRHIVALRGDLPSGVAMANSRRRSRRSDSRRFSHRTTNTTAPTARPVVACAESDLTKTCS